ncbi:Mu transposase C-terminal domain-containing protein [Streptomyces ipomoeae]|uniref:Mu transposase C-terminal domain-containing protein n=1 Tax=Streptomyces ipomoeae TaxID=103232 RepID=UPI001F2E329B|nr:Mu transposase C-terminal domain-containing protein [Streptomyces ipomoeae]MDX2700433.1 Mu transposase C-terminal domain-containing protein [Streptomyces ipomoeae]MDX2842114.1 Mu transposase C-terminal domain-containing protein [Streptomyces ipomoeae]
MTALDDASEAPEVGLGRHRDELRPAAVRQLLGLRGAGELTTAHVRLVAESVGVSVRQVWRWLAQAEETGSTEKPERRRFRITDEIIDVLADYQGNVKRAHEHLVRMAEEAGEKPVGLTTLHDAIARDLDPGFMAGLREGIPAARGFDPAFQRPAVARNQVWEGDHKQVPLVVMMPDEKLSKVWVTWFEDRGTGYVMGWAVTVGSAHRGSVLAAVRASVLREDPYGPAGGLPELVRVDGGADFLSRTVRRAFGLLGVPVHRVRSARHKGGIERLNRTSMTRFFADLPRYTKAPRLDHRRRVGDGDPPLTFEAFVGLLREWVTEHNTKHVVKRTGVTPLEAWLADPTEIRPEPGPEELRAFMLESDHRPRKITSHGVEFAGRCYMPENGVGRIGVEVRVRWMPHHSHEIDLYTFRGDRYLGRAFLSDEATEELRTKVLDDRQEHSAALRRALQRSGERRRDRYLPATEPQLPVQATRMTREEALAELAGTSGRAPAAPRRREEPYQPLTPIPAGWARPGQAPAPSNASSEDT